MSAIHDYRCPKCRTKLGTLDERDGDEHNGTLKLIMLLAHAHRCAWIWPVSA